MLNRSALLTLAMVLAAAIPAAAQGIIIPNEPDLPPLALHKHRVKVEIDRQAATTSVEQVFVNNTDRSLEAQYVFPIPKGATMSHFTMLVNGKEQEGQIVEKTEARRIYTQIVNRSQDPGLLESLGAGLFRASIFPILPRSSQTITLRFEQVVPGENGLVQYTYPVRCGQKKGPSIQGEFGLEVAVKSASPILSVYSPSHTVDVQRPNDREAKVTCTQRHTTLEKDFQLFYSVSDKEVGLDLLTYRPDGKDPGFFMLLVAPKSTLQTERIIERDVVFVVDVSGSMAGEKIKQARNALKYLVGKLNDADRFNIVQFSSFADAWQRGLVSARERRQDALRYADTLMAQGGTDIAGALDAALQSLPREGERPSYIVFMTDGQPTMGETDPRRILAKVDAARNGKGGESLRLFTWGVGYDVDTYLLDAMASQAGGVSEYVRPEEDIAVKVAAFANKASQPVMTGLELKVVGDRVQLVNLHPHKLPDLYAGSQLVLFGRYTGEGNVALQVTGRVQGKAESFTYEGKFAAAEPQHAFIEILWAQRRIGHLLDQIRMHGQAKEVVDDVIRLSKEYGIPTPYTSQLILENPRTLGAAPRGGLGGQNAARAGEPTLPPRRDWDDAFAKKLVELAGSPPASPLSAEAKPSVEPAKPDPARREAEEREKSLALGFKQKDGKAGVEAAMALRMLKESDKESSKAATSKKAAGTRFYLYREMWVDERFEATTATTVVKFGSEAYFQLIEREPKLVDALKLGTEIIFVVANGKALVIVATGQEKLTDAQIEEIFKPAAKP
jgi:Ca-activated chloride channel family protein